MQFVRVLEIDNPKRMEKVLNDILQKEKATISRTEIFTKDNKMWIMVVLNK